MRGHYSGRGTALVEHDVDRNTYKQGLRMPGTHRPIKPGEALLADQPDNLLLFAWSFRDEILPQQAEYVRRRARFIVPAPQPTILSPSGSPEGTVASATSPTAAVDV